LGNNAVLRISQTRPHSRTYTQRSCISEGLTPHSPTWKTAFTLLNAIEFNRQLLLVYPVSCVLPSYSAIARRQLRQLTQNTRFCLRPRFHVRNGMCSYSYRRCSTLLILPKSKDTHHLLVVKIQPRRQPLLVFKANGVSRARTLFDKCKLRLMTRMTPRNRSCNLCLTIDSPSYKPSRWGVEFF
jgi:hypothetical protein